MMAPETNGMGPKSLLHSLMESRPLLLISVLKGIGSISHVGSIYMMMRCDEIAMRRRNITTTIVINMSIHTICIRAKNYRPSKKVHSSDRVSLKKRAKMCMYPFEEKYYKTLRMYTYELWKCYS